VRPLVWIVSVDNCFVVFLFGFLAALFFQLPVYFLFFYPSTPNASFPVPFALPLCHLQTIMPRFFFFCVLGWVASRALGISMKMVTCVPPLLLAGLVFPQPFFFPLFCSFGGVGSPHTKVHTNSCCETGISPLKFFF